MGKNSGQAMGAIGRDDLLYFDPDQLVIVDDPKHPLFAMIGVFFIFTSANDNGPRRPGHLR
jgi:hypothetical protein